MIDFEVSILIVFHFLMLVEIATGTCAQQDTIYQAFIVLVVTTFTTLSMRGVVNLMGLQIYTSRVTMKTFGRNLTGIDKGWCRVAKLVIISRVFIDPFAT